MGANFLVIVAGIILLQLVACEQTLGHHYNKLHQSVKEYKERWGNTSPTTLPVQLYIDVQIISSELERSRETLITNAWVNISYHLDFNWQPENYGGVAEVQVPHHWFWKPELAITNMRGSESTTRDWFLLPEDNQQITITKNGLASITIPTTLETWCDFTYTSYSRFGCSIKFISWNMNSNFIQIEEPSESDICDEDYVEFNDRPISAGRNFNVESCSAEVENVGRRGSSKEYPQLTIHINFVRPSGPSYCDVATKGDECDTPGWDVKPILVSSSDEIAKCMNIHEKLLITLLLCFAYTSYQEHIT